MKKKPNSTMVDKKTYFIHSLSCPTCGRYLTSYSLGQPWTQNAMHEEEVRDCRGCGQEIDWSSVPKRPNLLRRG